MVSMLWRFIIFPFTSFLSLGVSTCMESLFSSDAWQEENQEMKTTLYCSITVVGLLTLVMLQIILR